MNWQDYPHWAASPLRRHCAACGRNIAPGRRVYHYPQLKRWFCLKCSRRQEATDWLEAPALMDQLYRLNSAAWGRLTPTFQYVCGLARGAEPL